MRDADRDVARGDSAQELRQTGWPMWLITVGAAVIIGTVIAPLAYYWPRGSPAEPGTSTADSAVAEFSPQARGVPIDISGTTLDGASFDLDAMRGQVVVINVWGSWCVPCREEAPVLARLSQEYRDVGFVGINVRDNPASARAFEDRYGIGYPSLDDPAGLSLLPLGDVVPARAVPSTVVLDREGRVASRIIGLLQETTLRSLIDTTRAEGGSG